MRIRTILIIGLLFFFFGPSPAFGVDYEHSVDLEQIRFEWKVEGPNLHIMLVGQTEGWVSVGFNPTRKMRDANIIIGFVKGDKVDISDEFGTTYTGHKSDSSIGGSEHISNVSGSEENGVTTLRFTIPLDSGDEKDGMTTVNGMTKVMFATGKRDSLRMGHNFRTTVDINLATGTFER